MSRIFVLSLIAGALSAGNVPALDTNAIERLTGLKGTWNERETVFKVSHPRTDVKVAVDSWPMPPFMGLTSWAAFMPAKQSEAMVMGDLVLFEDEVNPVMSAALDNGLEVTALHNHFFYDAPKVYFMHIGGDDGVEKLATGVRKALDRVKEIRAANPQPARDFGEPKIPESSSLTVQTVFRVRSIFPTPVEMKDGMLKIVTAVRTNMKNGCTVEEAMGVNTWAAFAGTDDNAVVNGDFAVSEDGLQEVLRALRRAGINIVAIHQHMIHESPRILFLHYWGKGKIDDLTRAIKAGWDAQSAKTTYVDFDDMAAGEPPAGWTGGATGGGAPRWLVEADETAPTQPKVLKQSGTGTFLWCVQKDVSLADGFVEMKFKPIAGKEDQAAGIVWRWKDKNTYYLLRANALEDNVRLYRVINGRRSELQSADAKVTANQWHTLRVEFADRNIIVNFDDRPMFTAQDKTIRGAGAVGVWTKADSVTAFDAFIYGTFNQ